VRGVARTFADPPGAPLHWRQVRFLMGCCHDPLLLVLLWTACATGDVPSELLLQLGAMKRVADLHLHNGGGA